MGQGVAGSRSLDQELQQGTELITEQEEQEGEQGYGPPLAATPDDHAKPEGCEGQSKEGFIGYQRHQNVKKGMPHSQIDEVEQGSIHRNRRASNHTLGQKHARGPLDLKGG